MWVDTSPLESSRWEARAMPFKWVSPMYFRFSYIEAAERTSSTYQEAVPPQNPQPVRRTSEAQPAFSYQRGPSVCSDAM